LVNSLIGLAAPFRLTSSSPPPPSTSTRGRTRALLIV
jgi:hypothetical protein